MHESKVVSPRALQIEIPEGIATLTLDRAETLNALTMDTFRALRDLFRAFQDDPFGRDGEGGMAAQVRARGLSRWSASASRASRAAEPGRRRG